MCATAVKKMTMRFWETTQILPKREAGVNSSFSRKPYVHTTVFDFSWDDCNTQEKLETVVLQNFEGALWVI